MFTLLPYRVRVLVDQGSESTGVIVESNLRGYPCLMDTHPSGDPEIPNGPPTYHYHVVFIKENTVEVEVDGVTYLVMGIGAIVGYINED